MLDGDRTELIGRCKHAMESASFEKVTVYPILVQAVLNRDDATTGTTKLCSGSVAGDGLAVVNQRGAQQPASST